MDKKSRRGGGGHRNSHTERFCVEREREREIIKSDAERHKERDLVLGKNSFLSKVSGEERWRWQRGWKSVPSIYDTHSRETT